MDTKAIQAIMENEFMVPTYLRVNGTEGDAIEARNLIQEIFESDEDWRNQTGIIEEPDTNRRPCMVHRKHIACRVRYILALILTAVYIASISTASTHIENPTIETGNGNLIVEWCMEDMPFYLEGTTLVALFSNKTVVLTGTEEQVVGAYVLLMDEWRRSTLGERIQMIVEWENL